MKTPYILYTLSACLSATLQEHHTLFVILSGAMLLDTLFWFLKAIRLKNFKSSRLSWGVISKFCILSFILFIAIVSNKAYPDLLWDQNVVNGIFGVLIMGEMISMTQNLQMIKTGEHIEEFDAVTKALKYINAFFRKIFEVKIK